MAVKEETEYGVVNYDKKLFEQIVQIAFEPYEGRIAIANYKGKGYDNLFVAQRYDLPGEKIISFTEKGVFIKVFTVIKFGESISKITGEIINSIVTQINDMMEVDIDDVQLVITAVLSKKASKRDLTISYNKLNGPKEAEDSNE